VTFGYSSRLQETSIKYVKGASTLFNQTNAFGTVPNNNGQITGITDAVDGGRSAAYTYDPLQRLKTANTTGSTNYPAWGLSWTYDQYGNRTQQIVTAGSAPGNPSPLTINASTNHITSSGYGYDAAGNMTSDGNNTLTYDAEGRVISASNGGGSGSYNYSGGSVRVHQVSTTSSGTTTSNSIYLGSNLIGQYDNQSGALGENIFLGGQRIAAVGGASVTNGGFESGSSGWTLTGVGASIVTNSAKAHSGNNYVQISTTSSATAQSPTFAVYPGDQIDFGGWVYLETGTAAAVDWVLMTLDSSHNQVAAVVPTPWSVTTVGAWTYETGSYRVASNVAYVYFYANVYQSSGTTTARFDDGFAIFGTHYFHPDQLSTRVTTDAMGAVIGQQGHFPYGESWYAQNSTTNWQFTSYQRDGESGNDYAMARSYVNRLARFSSPDPAGLSAFNPADPQTLNRYSYVYNVPVSLADPSGLGPDDCKSGCSWKSKQPRAMCSDCSSGGVFVGTW
jgi:RHS repeat-associated protein